MASAKSPSIIKTPLIKLPIAPGKFLLAYIKTKIKSKKPTKLIYANTVLNSFSIEYGRPRL